MVVGRHIDIDIDVSGIFLIRECFFQPVQIGIGDEVDFDTDLDYGVTVDGNEGKGDEHVR
jgi:hypothetical protein